MKPRQICHLDFTFLLVTYWPIIMYLILASWFIYSIFATSKGVSTMMWWVIIWSIHLSFKIPVVPSPVVLQLLPPSHASHCSYSRSL